MKYTLKFKLECADKYKNGEHIDFPDCKKQQNNFTKHVRCWAKAYDDLSIDGLKHSISNKK